MADKEYEIPVKVVDRRWWARPDDGSAPEPSGASKPTYVEDLERQLAEKDRLAQEYIAKYRQAAAEFDESRIRLKREISKDVERARREVLAEFLEILDNLDRALDAARRSPSAEALLQGVEMVQRQFLARLEGLGVTRIAADGTGFDPAVHEAVSTVPAAAPEADGQVVGVIRHGYRIGADVLRPASVAVARAAD